jgi:predicted phosphoribosyltransferase
MEVAMPARVFRDRRDAGHALANLLDHYRGRPDVVVLGLPRGGVPVAFEVATALGAPLDVFTVRKLRVPDREELAMGAVAGGGVVILNEDVINGLYIGPDVIHRAVEQEGKELLLREKAYREGRPPLEVQGKTVVLTDDGLATGASVKAAIQALKQSWPSKIVLAVPVAPESTCRELACLVDEVACATTPSPFTAVGASYWDFTQTSELEVRNLLREAASRTHSAAQTQPESTQAGVIRREAFPMDRDVPADDSAGPGGAVIMNRTAEGSAPVQNGSELGA